MMVGYFFELEYYLPFSMPAPDKDEKIREKAMEITKMCPRVISPLAS